MTRLVARKPREALTKVCSDFGDLRGRLLDLAKSLSTEFRGFEARKRRLFRTNPHKSFLGSITNRDFKSVQDIELLQVVQEIMATRVTFAIGANRVA